MKSSPNLHFSKKLIRYNYDYLLSWRNDVVFVRLFVYLFFLLLFFS